MVFDCLVLSTVDKVAGFLGYNRSSEANNSEIDRKNRCFGILSTDYVKSFCYISMPLLYDEIYHEEPSIIVVGSVSSQAIQKNPVAIFLHHFCTIFVNYIPSTQEMQARVYQTLDSARGPSKGLAMPDFLLLANYFEFHSTAVRSS